MYEGKWKKAYGILEEKGGEKALWKGIALVFLNRLEEAKKTWQKGLSQLKVNLSTLPTQKALLILCKGAQVRSSPLLGRDWQNDKLFYLGLRHYIQRDKALALKIWQKGLTQSPQREHPFYLLQHALRQFSK